MTVRALEPLSAPLGAGDLLLGTLTFNVGTIHWVQIEQSYDAMRLLRQTLTSMSQARAALVSTDTLQQELLNDLPADQGPRELAFLTIKPSRMRAMLRALPSELDRAIRVENRLIILALSSEAFSENPLGRWVETVEKWLNRRSATLLVLCEGEPAGFSAQLYDRAPGLSGFAQLYRDQATPRLLIHYWHNRPASGEPREVLLTEHADGFRTIQMLANSTQGHDAAQDLHKVHAERAALAGIRNEPLGWQVYPDRPELLHHAATASYATIILGVSRSDEVDELVLLLDRLRRSCGNNLKLIVREVAPCLRYRDDQLLIAAGASLIMPFGTPIARSLTLIDSIQGHTWQRQSPTDIADSLNRSKPLPLRGQLTPRVFAESVRQMWIAKQHGELEHTLLRIRVLPGLSVESLLGESRFRRQGDILCTTPGELYLFLFACRGETVEAALDNIFPLSWQELFVSFERLDDLDALARPLFLAEDQPALSLSKTTSPGPLTRALVPQPVRLELAEESRS